MYVCINKIIQTNKSNLHFHCVWGHFYASLAAILDRIKKMVSSASTSHRALTLYQVWSNSNNKLDIIAFASKCISSHRLTEWLSLLLVSTNLSQQSRTMRQLWLQTLKDKSQNTSRKPINFLLEWSSPIILIIFIFKGFQTNSFSFFKMINTNTFFSLEMRLISWNRRFIHPYYPSPWNC